jgi:hypothetical protein
MKGWRREDLPLAKREALAIRSNVNLVDFITT